MEKGEISFAEAVSILVKWRKFIVINFLAFCIIAAVISLLLPPWYTAQTTLLPPEGQTATGSGLMSLMEGLPISMPALPGMVGPSDIYIAILRSRNVREGVIKKLNLMQVYKAETMEMACEILANRTKIDKTEENIIVIKVTDRSRQRAAAIARAYVEELDRVNKNLRTSTARYTREFIEKRLKETEERLIKAAEALKEFQEKYKTVSIEDQTRAAIEAAAQVRAEIMLQEVKYNVLRRNLDESHSEVKKVKYNLMELQKQLEKIETGVNLNDGEYLIPFSEIPDLKLRLTFLTRDLEVQKALYKLLTEQYEQAKIQEAKDTPTIQVLDKAVPPQKRSKPKRRIIVMIAAILSLFVSGFVIFSSEYYQNLKTKNSQEYTALEKALLTLKGDVEGIKRVLLFKKRRS